MRTQACLSYVCKYLPGSTCTRNPKLEAPPYFETAHSYNNDATHSRFKICLLVHEHVSIVW